MALTAAAATLGAGIASGVGGLASTASGLFNSQYKQRKMMRYQASLQYKYQQMAAEAEKQRNIELWNMENEYNTASNQRKRLEEAGLLGASLFAGSSAGQASQLDSSTPSGPSVSIPSAANVSPGFQAGQQFADLALKTAQIGNIDADTKLKSEQADTQSVIRDVQRSVESLNAAVSLSHQAKAALDKTSTLIMTLTKDLQVESLSTNIDALKASIGKTNQEVVESITRANLNRAQTNTAISQMNVLNAQVGVMRALEYVHRTQGNVNVAQFGLISQLAVNAAKDGTLKDIAIDIDKSRRTTEYHKAYGGWTRSGDYIAPEWMSNQRLSQSAANMFHAEKQSQIVNNWTGIADGAMNLSLLFLNMRKASRMKF